MTFEEDLTKRRIDVAAFAAGDPSRFAEWQQMYTQMHPNSFYVSVKMVINDVRRRFWLAEAIKPAAAPATEAAAKPAARRATIPAAVAKPATAPAPEAAAENAVPLPAPGPAKARAIIRRPATASTDTPSGITETPVTATPAPPSDTSSEAPKPPRARPVFRKPAADSDNTGAISSSESAAERDGTNSEIPVHTNPDPNATAPKPARPRPVIKRPVVRDSPEDPEEIVPTSASAIPDPVPDSAPETNTDEPTAAKPGRPRPIFKRPAPAATPAETTPASEEVTHLITPPVPEPVGERPVAGEANQEPPAVAKPPRPRPVIRRLAPPPVESSPLNDLVPPDPAPLAVEPSGNIPPAAEAAVPLTPTDSDSAEEPRKPPRPRPVFKRPAPPDKPA